MDLLPEDESDEEREALRREQKRADADRRRAKRQAAKRAAAAALNPPGEGLSESSGSPREGSASPTRSPSIRGKLERHQGKASPVTGESYGGNRGKLAPDIPELTSEDAPYQVIRPQVYRPGNIDHPAPCVAGQRASSQAESALPDDLLSFFTRISLTLDGLTEEEAIVVRDRLRSGAHSILIIREIRKSRERTGSAA